MDLSKIEQIAQLMKAHGLVELEIEQGDERVRLAFAAQTLGIAPLSHPSMLAPPLHSMGGYVTPAAAPPAPNARAPETPSKAATEGAAVGVNQRVIKSPFVGTYYEAHSPGAEPFVRVGKRVKKGDTLCIVEAMKLMNGIESEFDGVVAKILAKNGEPVEFDQPLFIIEP